MRLAVFAGGVSARTARARLSRVLTCLQRSQRPTSAACKACTGASAQAIVLRHLALHGTGRARRWPRRSAASSALCRPAWARELHSARGCGLLNRYPTQHAARTHGRSAGWRTRSRRAVVLGHLARHANNRALGRLPCARRARWERLQGCAWCASRARIAASGVHVVLRSDLAQQAEARALR
jgi:hypothetical protein